MWVMHEQYYSIKTASTVRKSVSAGLVKFITDQAVMQVTTLEVMSMFALVCVKKSSPKIT